MFHRLSVTEVRRRRLNCRPENKNPAHRITLPQRAGGHFKPTPLVDLDTLGPRPRSRSLNTSRGHAVRTPNCRVRPDLDLIRTE